MKISIFLRFLGHLGAHTQNFSDFVVNLDVELESGFKHEVGDEVEGEVGSTEDEHEGDDVPVKVKFCISTKEYTARDVVQCPN